MPKDNIVATIVLSHDSREPVTIEDLRRFVAETDGIEGEMIRDENADTYESVTWHFVKK